MGRWSDGEPHATLRIASLRGALSARCCGAATDAARALSPNAPTRTDRLAAWAAAFAGFAAWQWYDSRTKQGAQRAVMDARDQLEWNRIVKRRTAEAGALATPAANAEAAARELQAGKR